MFGKLFERKKESEFDFEKAQTVLCKLRWGYPIVNFGQRAVRTCCRTQIHRVSDNDVGMYRENLFLNHPHLKNLRSEMLAGIRSKDCESCWKLEDAGMRSPRQNFENIEELARMSSTPDGNFFPYTESHQPYMIDIELSNICDAKCMYCNRIFSSRWAQEDIALGRATPEIVAHEARGSTPEFEENFWRWFEKVHPGIVHINFIGGEPLLNRRYFEIVEKMNALHDRVPVKDRNFVTVSNFNSPDAVMDRFIELLPELTKRYNVNIDASMEAFGAQAEYIRDGVVWDRWVKNVRRILELKLDNFELGIQSALNVLSLAGLPRFFKEIRNLRDEYGARIVLKTNIVSYPNFHSPYVATADLVAPIREAAQFVLENHRPELDTRLRGHGSFNWNRYAGFLNQLADTVEKSTGQEAERAEFFRWVQEYDKIRGRHFEKTFPEYQNFLSECRRQFELRS